MKQLLNPPIELILKNINAHSTFSMIRLTIEWWKMVGGALETMKMKELPDNLTDEFIEKLAYHMLDAAKKQRGVRPWKVKDSVFADIIKYVSKHPLPETMLVGAGSQPMTASKKLYMPTGSEIKLISKIVPENNAFFAPVWRRYAFTGELDWFLKKINRYKIVVVGPWYFKNFGQKANLQNFFHIEIHRNNAILHVEQTFNRILKFHKKNIANNEKIVYLCCGGPAVIWPIINLHDKIDNAVLLDVGMSIQVYYYYDPIRKNSPRYFWGTWLDKFPPKWLKPQ